MAMSNTSKRAWLKPFLRPVYSVFREVLAMSAFVNMMALAVPVFTLQVYDRVIGHAGISTLVGFIIGMIIIVAFDYILRMSRSRIMQTVALRIDVLVGHKLFHKLMELPLQELEGRPASYWQALFRDVDTVRNTLSGASALLACDLPFFFMFFALIALIAPPLVPVLMVIMPLFMFIAWRSAAAMSEANQTERQTTQSRDALIAEMIHGRATVKALALDKAMGPMWADRHAENIETSVRRGSKSDFFSSFGGSLTMMTTVMMTSAGAFLIIEGAITMGGLVATNMLTGRLIGPLNQLVGQWRTFNNFKQSVERLGEVFSMQSERTESEIALERPSGEIVVEGVNFSYAEDLPPVLENISIKLAAGGVHALVGRNGSGKTTLMKIIQGLYHPQQGRVLMDGADIAQFSRIELTNWIGYVPQETVLFAGTIRDNIIHRRPDASDEEIVKASTAAGVHHFIIDLPDGYGTEIGEAGARLSGGQRQRISIARALLGDPPVLLLDEPSASLDRQAEQALRKTLVEIGEERSVIIVTHSPILLAACDDLVALDKGKVALAGPAREILPKLFGQQPRAAGPEGGDAPAGPAGHTKPEDLPKPVEPPSQGQPAPRPPAPKAPPIPTGVKPGQPRPAVPAPQPAAKPAGPPVPRPPAAQPGGAPAAAAPRPAAPRPAAPRPAAPRPAAPQPAAPRPAAPRPAATKPPAPAAAKPAPPRPAPPKPAAAKPAPPKPAAPRPAAPAPQAAAAKPTPPPARGAAQPPKPAAPTPAAQGAQAPAARPTPPAPRPTPPPPTQAAPANARPANDPAPAQPASRTPARPAPADDDPYADLIKKTEGSSA